MRIVTAEQAVECVKSGDRVFVHGGAATPTALLQALARPHLSGIVAHAVNRVITRLGSDNAEEETPPEPQAINMSPSSFGKEILAALTSKNTAMFGHEGEVPPSRRKPASQSHINALKAMSSKNPKTPPKK